VGAYTPPSYGDSIAPAYDRWPGLPTDTADTVALLFELARGGRVLDVGAGTGRIAIPLAARGLRVRAVDVSREMLAQLRAKPGGDAVAVTAADFTALRTHERYALIVLAYNTLLYFFTRDAQRRCLANAARLLAPGGLVVVETYVPDPARYDRGQRVAANRIDDGALYWFGARDDPVAQTATAQQICSTAGTELHPSHTRRIVPAELTLLARAAGLRLRERWSGWKRERVGARTSNLVSVFERAPGPRSVRRAQEGAAASR
jgi:ubiquinone/menaquinone biosynthesis C-methylase UbiE